MSEWKEVRLGDFIVLQRGHDLPKSKMKNGKIPVAGSNGIIGYHNVSTTKGIGITIGRSGNLGNAYLYKEDFWAHNTTLYVKDFKGNDEIFAYYFLKNIDFKSFNVGSAVPTLNRNHIHPISIKLPPLPEQQAIAEVLSSLDDKIDLLHRQNQTLEQMAGTLFRQWFVEEAQEDWEERPLSSIADILIGRTPPRKEKQWFSTNPKDIKWISIKDMGNSGVFVFKTSEYLTQEAVKIFNIPIIPKNTVVLSFKMTLGRVNITTEDMLSNEAIAQFRIKKDSVITNEFLYLFLKSYPYQTLGSTSSIVTSINSKMINEIQTTIPDIEIIKKFSSVVVDNFEKIKYNQTQIQTLEKLRDTLLPKLMSGEIRVEM